ncbi:ATP-dependent Clp protease proteolytic subunit [Thermocoleostomius sinensis]|jgi:ATP-dependent Clp protease protease subunit|uniref:ATP-dependent Clp protease proteolytic subunit n=1 Tax=Thermocoleostomius sinensis A174 TaxID=2016057 RepID=A0A9E8ZC40_9CYAN|nr:ATP-dependent Clp protease proteolytic subunit [Thermocoleostomius sinensis]WAL60519.1 ATP-dependent Clp protease proteolytic subunit [Thermocoleostomius sinensis A174]
MPVERTIRVPYNIPGSPYWQWVNIYTRMSQNRILFLDDAITDGTANALISALLYLDSEDQNKPIYLYINSLGDPIAAGRGPIMAGMVSVMAGLAIYDTIQHIKSEVITICFGQAVGMATLLLSSGAKGKRASLPHASIVLDNPQTGTQGQATDIQVSAKEVLDKKHLILDIFSRNTGKSIDDIIKDTDRTLYLTPQQAKDYGLIDHVLESSKLSNQQQPALT